MANGDAFAVVKSGGIGKRGVGFKLFDNSFSAAGKWCDVRTLEPGSVEVFGNFGSGNVRIAMSNAAEKPDDLADYGQPVLNITAAGIYAVPIRARWIKAYMSSGSGGALTVNYHSTT